MKELRVKLEIDGRKDGSRYLVMIGGCAVYLSAVPFKMLAILALERCGEDGDGWVDTKDLDEHAAQYMWKLRDCIKAGLGDRPSAGWAVAESLREGRYRLLAHPRLIKFTNLQALIDFDNHAITTRLRGPGRVLKQ